MRRLTLPLNLLFSVVILITAARILADIASYKLGTSPAKLQIKGTQQPNLQLQHQTQLQGFAAILDKSLFGPATKGVLTPAQQPSVSTAPPVSQSDLSLLGTAIGSPRASFVLVRRNSSNEERVFRLGEKVFDLGTLSAIKKETAEVRSGSQLITLRTPSAPAESAKPAQPAAGIGVTKPMAGGSGIIDQRALNAALDNIGQAMTDARLLPSVKDGKVEGFKVSEVKPQGVFAAVGLKNSDILVKINEFPIDSPEKAIQSFVTLKGQNRIKLDLIRDGAPTTLTYDIR
ncbi:MAG: type II secretion system protein N [Geobacter sp.]|nr:type II secretion system protein N [Geobacter sp.]